MDSGIDLLTEGAGQIGIYLRDEEKKKFHLYGELIHYWNRKMNLVSCGSEEELYRLHFLDSLMCSLGYDMNAPRRVIDLGSGAGFPALPLKICFPNLRFCLVESRKKRSLFLRTVVAELDLKDCLVISERLENIASRKEYRAVFDCAVARALAPLRVLLELGLPFLRCKKGKLVALKGYEAQKEIDAADKALRVLRGRVEGVIPYSFPGERGRHVIVIAKDGETPDKFPRRPGAPAKRPL
jgi:16S rRNA (guanine527-N7)-methyltransferase